MNTNNRLSILLILFTLTSFGSSFGQGYILIGWNDLGMHCSNKDFSKIAVLPPYNNVRAQLIRKLPNQKPQIITTGYTVEYSIPGNTYSVGKTNFWTYAQKLFNLTSPLPPNIGLTGNGLKGKMIIQGNNFIATGIPVTPFQDNDLVNEKPYQLIHLVAKAINNSTILAVTDVVIPVSNEITCASSGCHSSEIGILRQHDEVKGFNRNGPVLCASCHASNALGTTGMKEARSLSFRIHDQHKDMLPFYKIETCYRCHPGAKTQCFRDVMRNGVNKKMICQDCHGTMKNVAESIEKGRRPWLDEPKCGSCHGSLYAEESGKLYRESKGHGGLFCSSCHGSPHAIYPTTVANDNLQNIRLQGFAGTLQKCLVCHSTPPTGSGPHGIKYSASTISNTTQTNSQGAEEKIIPDGYDLRQNYPNPFNPSTKIVYSIPEDNFVEIKVFNIDGQEVTTLVKNFEPAGEHEVTFDTNNLTGITSELPSGIYFYTLRAGSTSITKKMILLR